MRHNITRLWILSTVCAVEPALHLFAAMLRAMRPRQWTKNVLFVLPAIVFDVKLLDIELLGRVAAAGVLLVLITGSVYIINDLLDLEQDRAHPTKRKRPLASGALPVELARLQALVLAIVALSLAYALDADVAILLAIYLAIQILYSLYLKHMPLLDVLIVAAGFVIRVLIGGVVIDVVISPWLLAFTGLLALFLVIGKRRQELVTLGESASQSRSAFRHYNLPLLDDMLRIATTSTLITYILYTIEVETMTKQGVNFGLLTIPFLLYGLMRYLYLLHVEATESPPDEVLLADRPIQIAVALAGVSYFVILYLL